MKIFLHHPGQLFRNGLDPVLRGQDHKNTNLIRLNIQSVTVLKKRRNGIGGCNKESSNEDEILFWNKVKLFNCTANYQGEFF